MNKKTIYFPAIFLLVLSSFFIVKKIKKKAVPRIDLPALVIEDLNGAPVSMSAFAGKPLVINFWATWCGPCRQELPGFEQARQKYGDRVNFLMISDEVAAKITAFKEASNYTFFFAHSPKTFKDLGFKSIPVTYFYTGKGQLSAKKNDPLDEQELYGLIEAMNRE